MKNMCHHLARAGKSEGAGGVRQRKSGITGSAGLSTLRCLFAGLAVFSVVFEVSAGEFVIRPIFFENGADFSITATGTLGTAAGTSTINDWNLTVTTAERLAHYSRSNTRNFSAGGVRSDGQHLTVATSADGIDDGGSLFFRSPNPFVDFGVAVADFTGANANGGQAFYLAGGAFDFLDLNQTPASEYTAADLDPSSGNLFDLVPLTFSGGVTLSGTILTDGTQGLLGLSNILAWDIYVDQLTQDVFNRSNSVLLADQVALSPDGLNLTVNNPEGFLAFTKGNLGGRPHALQLADFSGQSPAGGQAGYFQGRLAVNTLDLLAPNGPWTVTGTVPVTQPVPEPASSLLAAIAFAGFSVLRIHQRTKKFRDGRSCG